MSILASNRQAAEKTAKRLRQLPQVKAVVTINNLIPKNQDEKLEQIEDMALVMPPVPQQPERQTAYQYQLNKTALAELSRTLDGAINSGKIEGLELSTIRNLADNMYAFEQRHTALHGFDPARRCSERNRDVL